LTSRSTTFSKKLCNWYLSNGRKDLPWRKTSDPYKIWISEIMLQQTQVKTVIPYYLKFIKRYPNIKSLLNVKEDEILALWSGLGFYRRAKNIFKAKEIIKKKHSNIFPTKYEEIISLPGIGRSTAGAIMSIAYKKPYPILDANVKRVIAKFENIDISNNCNESELWEISLKFTPSKNIFEYTQAIMDIGATICKARSQDCPKCPLNKNCKSAYQTNKIQNLKKKPKNKQTLFLKLAHSKNSFLLFKRTKKSFWDGLWIPYEKNYLTEKDFFKKHKNKTSKEINHSLSHIDLKIKVDILDFADKFDIKTNAIYEWVQKNEIHNYGLPKPIKTIIEDYEKNHMQKT